MASGSWKSLCSNASLAAPDCKHLSSCYLPPAGSAIREVLNSTSTMLAAVEIQNPVMTVNCEPWNIGGQRLSEYSAYLPKIWLSLCFERKKVGSPSLERKKKKEKPSCVCETVVNWTKPLINVLFLYYLIPDWQAEKISRLEHSSKHCSLFCWCPRAVLVQLQDINLPIFPFYVIKGGPFLPSCCCSLPIWTCKEILNNIWWRP